MVEVWEMKKEDILEAAEKLEEIASEALELLEDTYYWYDFECTSAVYERRPCRRSATLQESLETVHDFEYFKMVFGDIIKEDWDGVVDENILRELPGFREKKWEWEGPTDEEVEAIIQRMYPGLEEKVKELQERLQQVLDKYGIYVYDVAEILEKAWEIEEEEIKNELNGDWI